MIILLSPAKRMDESPLKTDLVSMPRLLDKSEFLLEVMKKKSKRQLKNLMHISDAIAQLNVERYTGFEFPYEPNDGKAALFLFKGDVYLGLKPEDLDEKDLEFAQDHLRILSGLYGFLKPFDHIKPYRLEMGVKLRTRRGKDLYTYWGSTITDLLNEDLKLQSNPFVVNLASIEYFQSIDQEKLLADLYQVDFKEKRNGSYKILSFNAKKARGLMSSYLISNRVTKPEDIKAFNLEDYRFNESLSAEKHFVFTR